MSYILKNPCNYTIISCQSKKKTTKASENIGVPNQSEPGRSDWSDQPSPAPTNPWLLVEPRNAHVPVFGSRASYLFNVGTPNKWRKRKMAKLVPWKSKTKQRMVFRMIHIKDSLLPMGKVWSLDSLGVGRFFGEPTNSEKIWRNVKFFVFFNETLHRSSALSVAQHCVKIGGDCNLQQPHNLYKSGLTLRWTRMDRSQSCSKMWNR